MISDSRISLLTVIDQKEFPALQDLPFPTKFNTGGFRVASADNPQYSPIDLSIAGFESLRLGIESVKDLRTFFKEHKFRQAEEFIIIGIGQTVKTVTNWKHYLMYADNSGKIYSILKQNAPFTFI